MRRLPPSQPVQRQQQQDGVVANVRCPIAAGGGKQPLHVIPLGAFRNALAHVKARCVDGSGHTGPEPVLRLGVAKEAAQVTRQRRQRRAAPALAMLCFDEGIDVVDRDHADGCSRRPQCCEEPGQPIATRRDRHRREPPFVSHEASEGLDLRAERALRWRRLLEATQAA